MSDTPNKHTVIAPFNSPNGDVILRSSDEVDFHVVKAILSLSSPFFTDLFAVPQPPSIDSEGEAKPVIQVEEDAVHLDHMLLFLYPCPDPVITQPEEMQRMLDITLKYDLPIISQRLEVGYMHSGKYKTKPIEAYFFACHYQWQEAARLAAKATLRYSNEELIVEELKSKPATLNEYRELLVYHTRIRNACRHMCTTGGDTTPISTSEYCHTCRPRELFGPTHRARCMPAWFIKYMDRVGIEWTLSRIGQDARYKANTARHP